MTFHKEWAINKANQFSKRTKQPYIVIHDPDTYNDIFNGTGFKTFSYDEFLNAYGVDFLISVIYHTHPETTKENRYA